MGFDICSANGDIYEESKTNKTPDLKWINDKRGPYREMLFYIQG